MVGELSVLRKTPYWGSGCSGKQPVALRVTGADARPEHAHENVYDGILGWDDRVLQRQASDAEDHSHLVSAKWGPPGDGISIWLEVKRLATL